MREQSSRRKLLKGAGIATVGLASWSTTAVASGENSLDDRTLHGDSVAVIDDVYKLGTSEHENSLLIITLEERNQRTNEVSYHDFGVKIPESGGDIAAEQLSSSQSEALKQSNDDQVTIQNEHWPDAPDVVKKTHHLAQHGAGGCGAFNHEHQKEGVSLWFYQDVGTISVGTAFAALGGYIAYTAGSLLGAVGGLAGVDFTSRVLKDYVSTENLSFVIHEFDVSKWGWTQTMYGVDFRPQWKEYNPNNMFTISVSAGHPSCGNCGFPLNKDNL